MVEVFKTNVVNPDDANSLVAQLGSSFGYAANFDLDDCDLILRVQTFEGLVSAQNVIALLNNCGFWAAVLADEFTEMSTTGHSL